MARPIYLALVLIFLLACVSGIPVVSDTRASQIESGRGKARQNAHNMVLDRAQDLRYSAIFRKFMGANLFKLAPVVQMLAVTTSRAVARKAMLDANFLDAALLLFATNRGEMPSLGGNGDW
eukprot:CAMPEP_0113888590 /NCGR_PEP_ID=MMETSP0780_2-20120614/12952_1 /TAXON_ID=652834 /ORGANISM="Palpitomonas bilix" /LENGTH=120 /DNA_ID=CAMNT_0000877447 /DNA_START=25 /DNA_END=388 /DNA_ORIENTATION=+ /assembly_acc=CAM_ASM_000599